MHEKDVTVVNELRAYQPQRSESKVSAIRRKKRKCDSRSIWKQSRAVDKRKDYKTRRHTAEH